MHSPAKVIVFSKTTLIQRNVGLEETCLDLFWTLGFVVLGPYDLVGFCFAISNQGTQKFVEMMGPREVVGPCTLWIHLDQKACVKLEQNIDLKPLLYIGILESTLPISKVL